MTVMSAKGVPSGTSRSNPYKPVKRKPWEPGPGEPDHPLVAPLRDINRVMEDYKRDLRETQKQLADTKRQLLAYEAENVRLRGLLRPELSA